jgi:hypothetical protein
MPDRYEADEISLEELEAAGEMYDILASEGWAGWKKRQEEALAWLDALPGKEEALRASLASKPCELV